MTESSTRKFKIDWGHILVATLIVGFCIWYLLDTRDTSLRISNLIFVQPGVVLAIILYLLILPQCVQRIDSSSVNSDSTATSADLTWVQLLRVASLAVAFGLFILGMETLGFDVSAWLFMIAGLFISGERRWWVLAVFPAALSILIVYGYALLIPYSFPTMFL